MMNGNDFQEHQKKLLGDLLEVCRKKQREYANAENAFHNFDNAVGLSLANSREVVAWEFCVKHLQSVRDIIEGVSTDGVTSSVTQKLIDEKFGDIIVYMTLIHGMLTDKICEYEKNKKSVIVDDNH